MSFRKNQWKQNNLNDGSSGSNSGQNNNGRGQWFNNNNHWKKRGDKNHRNYGSSHPRRNGLMEYGSGNQSSWYYNNYAVDNIPHRIDSMPAIESPSTFQQTNINQYPARDRSKNRTYSQWQSDNFNSGRTSFYPQQFNEPDYHNDDFDIAGFDESRNPRNIQNDHTSTSSLSLERSSDSSTPNHPYLQDTPALVSSHSRSDVPSAQSSNQQKLQEEIQPLPMSSVRPDKIRSAEEVTKKLMNQLTSMDKHNLKQIINNPNSKYDAALQSHAIKKNREEVRKQLRIMSMDQETIIEPDECIDSDKIPDAIFEEIERVLDVNLFSNSDRRSSVKLARPDDILLRADQILMDEFLLDRIQDTAEMHPSSISPQPPPSIRFERDKISLPDETIQNSFINMLEKDIDQDKTMPNLGNVSCLSVGFDLDRNTDISSPKETITNVPQSKLASVRSKFPKSPSTTAGSDGKSHVDMTTRRKLFSEMPAEKIQTQDQNKNSATLTTSVKALHTQETPTPIVSTEIVPVRSVVTAQPVKFNQKSKEKQSSTMCTPKQKEQHLRQEIQSVSQNVKSSKVEVPAEPIIPEKKKTVDLKTKLQNLTAIKSSRQALLNSTKSTHTSAITQLKTAKNSNLDRQDKDKHQKMHPFKNDSSDRNTPIVSKKRRRSSSSDSRSSSSTSKRNCSTKDSRAKDENPKKIDRNYVSKDARAVVSKEARPESTKKTLIERTRPDFVPVGLVNINDALSNIYNTCMENLGNLEKPEEIAISNKIDVVDDKLMDSVEKLTTIKRSESDDEECRKIIDNIESLIEKELRPSTPSNKPSSSGITLVKLSDLMLPINDTTEGNGNVIHEARPSIDLDSKDTDASEPDTEMVVAENHLILEPSHEIADFLRKEESVANTCINIPHLPPITSTTDTILPESMSDTAKSKQIAENPEIIDQSRNDDEHIITEKIVEVHHTVENECLTTQNQTHSSDGSKDREENTPKEVMSQKEKSPKKKKKRKNKKEETDDHFKTGISQLNDHRESAEKSVTSSATDIQLDMGKPIEESVKVDETNQQQTSELNDINSDDPDIFKTPKVKSSINCKIDTESNETKKSAASEDSDKKLNNNLKSVTTIEMDSLITSNSKDETVALALTEESSSKILHSPDEVIQHFESTSIPIPSSTICPTLSPVVVITTMPDITCMPIECAASTSTIRATTDAISNLKPITVAASETSNSKALAPSSLPIPSTRALSESKMNVKSTETIAASSLAVSTKTFKEEKISVKKTISKQASKIVPGFMDKKDTSKHKIDSSSSKKNKHRHRERDREHEEHSSKKGHRSDAKSREDNVRHKSDFSSDRATVVSKICDQPRLWRSPGEKKIIEPTKVDSNPELERTKKLKDNKDKNRGKHNDPRHSDESLTSKCSISPLIDSRSQPITSTGLLQVREAASNAVSTFTSLNDQGRSIITESPPSSSDPILNRMKEIDLKLMEYQKDKMSIDQIILKYQTEKMTIEEKTMELQNERFQLLSSMLANSNNANSQLLASCFSNMRPQEPLTIDVPNPEVPSVIDLTKAHMTDPDKTIQIKHKKSNSKKRCLESQHKDVEHHSKKAKLSTKPSSHSKPIKSRKSSETASKCNASMNEPLRGHSQKSKLNETYEEVTIDLTSEQPASSKISPAVKSCQTNAPLDSVPASLSTKKYRHLITKECCIKLKRFNRNELNTILSTPILSETTSILESESESESKVAEAIEDPNTQPKPDDKTMDSDFLGFSTPISSFDGRFIGHRMPIVFMQVINNWVVAASEDGNIYKYNINTGQLEGTFTQHSKTVTAFITTDINNILSVSLDGSLRKFQLENFGVQMSEFDLSEPLQVIEYCWNTAFIGSRSGKIYVYDTKIDKMNEEYMCSVGKSIMALKAAREGPRNILIVSSRTNHINVRDAQTGLLLRTIEVPDKVTIYSILLDGGIIHCGTNQNKIISYEFTSGNEIGRKQVGIGAICMRLFKGKAIMCGCYDGNIYAYDKFNGNDIHQMQGPGKMLLHFDIVNNKIIGASKDNKSLRIWDISDEITSYISAKR